jgi:membrane associated rhomboid family serine protease
MNNPYPITRGVKVLLIANVAVFFVQLLPGIGERLTGAAALIPFNTFYEGQVWRLATYMFLHSTGMVFHLLLNMFALWMFGGVLEERWGTKKFIGLYAMFGATAALFGALYLFDVRLRFVPVVGASGAVFGLLTSYALYYPNRDVLLFFVLPVRAWIMVAGFAVLSLLMAFSHEDGIAHLVHLGGIAAAFIYLKGGPVLAAWRRDRRELRNERETRRRAEELAGRKKHYEEKVDPLLEKISREGMGALTREEIAMLKNVWRNRQ